MKINKIETHDFCTICVQNLHDLHFFFKKGCLYAIQKSVRQKCANRALINS